MNKEDIRVSYISGIEKESFVELESLGFDLFIPKEKFNSYNFEIQPDSYLEVFKIVFSAKIIEKLIENFGETLGDKIYEVIKNIWSKHKNAKPAIVHSGKKPEYKLPKAKIVFKISDDEFSSFEISNLNDKKLKSSMKTYLKLVKLQYKNRIKEAKIQAKIK